MTGVSAVGLALAACLALAARVVVDMGLQPVRVASGSLSLAVVPTKNSDEGTQNTKHKNGSSQDVLFSRGL